MDTRLVANRIEKTFTYAARGTLPTDHSRELREDIESIRIRYSVLRRKLSFDEASSVARTEFIMRVLEEAK